MGVPISRVRKFLPSQPDKCPLRREAKVYVGHLLGQVLATDQGLKSQPSDVCILSELGLGMVTLEEE